MGVTLADDLRELDLLVLESLEHLVAVSPVGTEMTRNLDHGFGRQEFLPCLLEYMLHRLRVTWRMVRAASQAELTTGIDLRWLLSVYRLSQRKHLRQLLSFLW